MQINKQNTITASAFSLFACVFVSQYRNQIQGLAYPRQMCSHLPIPLVLQLYSRFLLIDKIRGDFNILFLLLLSFWRFMKLFKFYFTLNSIRIFHFFSHSLAINFVSVLLIYAHVCMHMCVWKKCAIVLAYETKHSESMGDKKDAESPFPSLFCLFSIEASPWL